MTLNEKFEDALDVWNGVDICEKIADDFAIEFMNWCIKNYSADGIFLGVFDDKNLLNEFKKEKGL